MKINGSKVVDASRPVKLHISARDTTLGATKDPAACAAARACMREVPGCTAARIHLGRSYLKIGNEWKRFQTPESLKSEIIAFDRGGKFEAGEYTLRPLSPANTEAGRRAIQKKRASGTETNRSGRKLEKKLKKLRVRHVTTNVRSHGANR